MSASSLTEKLSTDKLIGVPETMLIPLFARAVETPRPDAICRDLKAVELVSRIDYLSCSQRTGLDMAGSDRNG